MKHLQKWRKLESLVDTKKYSNIKWTTCKTKKNRNPLWTSKININAKFINVKSTHLQKYKKLGIPMDT